MTTHVALLRAVNLPRHNKVCMVELCRLLGELGLRDGQSLLQSGNLVFRSDTGSGPALERLLESAARERLGLDTDFFVRSAADWKTLTTDNPFPAEPRRDPGHLVMFLKKAPDHEHATALGRAIKGREVTSVKGRHAYIVYPDGIGRSRLTTSLIERCLDTSGTGRNWNTVLKLGALV